MIKSCSTCDYVFVSVSEYPCYPCFDAADHHKWEPMKILQDYDKYVHMVNEEKEVKK